MAASRIRRSRTALHGFFRRNQARGDYRKAVVATAYTLARIVYRELKYGAAYVKTGLEEYGKNFREKRLQALHHRPVAHGM